jgi:GntR family transcriptional regulator/MocR family aminotransferase
MVKRTGGALLLSLDIDRSTSGTISNQLYAAMRDMIHAGGLNSGERLPASRTLAKDLASPEQPLLISLTGSIPKA